MKSKTLSVLSLSILMLVVMMASVSAASLAVSNVVGNESTVSQSDGQFQFQFDLTNSGLEADINWSDSTASAGNVDFSFSHNSIADGSTDSQTITITVTGDFEDSYHGIISGIIVANPSGLGDDAEISYSIIVEEPEEPEEITSCSLIGEGDLNVDIDDIAVKGLGDDEEWLPLDDITIDILVENENNDYDIDDIEVSWGLYNKDTGKWYIDDEEKDFDLKDDEDKELTIKFKLDDDIDELEDGDYVFYVWAKGNLDNDSDNGEDLCSFDSESIDLIIEDGLIILDKFSINGVKLDKVEDQTYLFSNSVSCGDKLIIEGEIWNIGDDDEDDVYIMAHNSELGINEKINIGDIDALDKDKFTFEFEVPKDLSEKRYELWFTIYDEDNEAYENDDYYENDEADFKVSIDVEGSCSLSVSDVSIVASLESGGKAGEELVIKAIVTNTGSKLASYTLNADKYSDWASLVSGVPSTVIIEAGQSKDVLMTFKVNSDVSGEKALNILVLSDGEVVKEYEVTPIQIEKAGFSFPFTGSAISEGNWYLWGIGALNIVLVIIIILVAVRVAKK